MIKELSEEIEKELRHGYRGLRLTSNTNKSLSNIMALVEELAFRSYQDGIKHGNKLTEEEYQEELRWEAKGIEILTNKTKDE